ncbi:hypothetical protein Taro_053264 [Colocasia esculenta]|uniref:Uncharacterized protein n=1 Tax=Colocasia esculenta TaxID=4460 RepID=A0A843XLP1_COLES|nr:hypothetical protein [Colocasia esculenta]
MLFPLSSSGGWRLAEGRRLVAELEWHRGARRWRPWCREGPLRFGSFKIVVVFVATPGCSIPAVCLPSDVATAVRVVTSEEASPWSDVTLLRRGCLSQLPFPSRWYRDGLGGPDKTWFASGVSVAEVVFRVFGPCRVCRRWLTVLLGVSGSAPHLRACPVQRLSPFLGTPILGSLLREFSGLRACSISPSHCLALRWFQSRVGRVGMGPQLGQAAVVGCVVLGCGSLASLYLGSLVALAYTVVVAWPCLVSVGSVGHPTAVSVAHSLVLSVVAPVCSSLNSWRVQSPGWFCLWALDLVEVWDVGACVVRFGSHVVALVFRELLVSAGACRVPAVLDGRDSLSQEFVAVRLWWQFVRRALLAV